MASGNNNTSDSVISQDDIDSLFSSIDMEQEKMDKDVSHKKSGSQVSQDDIDSMFASDDLEKESDSGGGSSQVSQDDIDSMFASDDLGKESDSGGGSSQVSQDDIDSMFASDDLEKESDSGGGSSQVSQDDIDSMFASDDLGKESDSGGGSSQVSQDDIDSMFASDDLEKESDSGGGSSQVSQDDIDSMFASDDLGKESDSGGGSSQVSQDDIDSMFASDDLGKESDSGGGSSQVSQDDIDSMFASDDLGKESDSGGGSSQVSQDDIDSLFDSETAQDSSEEKFSPDEFDDILKNSIPDLFDEDNDKPSERNVEKEPQDSKVPDFGDEEYDFSSVSQDAVDALLEGKSPKQGKADQGVNSDFSTELESGEISQADIEAILSEAKDLGVIDEEDADNDMDDVSATNDSDLAEMISQSEIDSLFGGASEISSENSEKPVEDVPLESEASDKAEDDFVPKDDWHLSQDEINGLLGSEDSENKSEKKDDEFIPKANGFEIEQDELDALLKSDSNDSDGKNTGDSGPEFEDGKGSNLISQEFLDYLEDEFLAQKEENDSDDLDVDDIFKDESSGDDILSDNEIDDLFGETSDDDVVADHAGDELDFISQDDIDELLGAVTEDESEEADDTYESFTESQEEPSEGVLSQEELDRLLNQQDDSPKEAANLDQAPVKEDHIPEKTVILEKEELAVEEEKGGGKKKKLIIFSIAASFIVLISAASVFFFISGKDAKAPVEIAEKTQDASDLITEPAADIPEQPFIEPAVISTVIFGELIVPAPLSSKKYSYLEVDVSVDIKGENNLVVFNKNNVFFRDVLFKTLDEEFKKISGKDDEKLERDQLESLLLKTLSNYFQENDVVKGLVFTRFEPV